MVNITIAFALFLIALGVGGYFLSGAASMTALIPAFFGVFFLVAGLIARRETLRRHAMHGAALLALVSVFGTFRGLSQLPALIAGETVARPFAVVVQGIMALATIGYLCLAIQSFLAARRKRS